MYHEATATVPTHSRQLSSSGQVKPFRKLRKLHNHGKRTRLRDLIRYDMRQMHAAFTGTLPVGSKAENTLGGAQVGPVHLPVHQVFRDCFKKAAQSQYLTGRLCCSGSALPVYVAMLWCKAQAAKGQQAMSITAPIPALLPAMLQRYCMDADLHKVMVHSLGATDKLLLQVTERLH